MAKEVDLRNIYYFSDPILVGDLWSEEEGGEKKKIVSIAARG